MILKLFQRLNPYFYKLSEFNKNNSNSFKNPIFIILSLLIGGLILFTYSNHFSNSFQFDDHHTINKNSAIHELNITDFFRDATTFSSLPANQTYRPLTTLENAIDYQLGNGLNPTAFHIHIFIIFLGVCVLICGFIKKILDTIKFSRHNQLWALLNASIFGLLCANAETVNYIIQRAEISAALFILLGFVAFLQGGFWRYKYVYLIFPFIGFFAKEMTFIFAPLLLLYVLLFEEEVDLLHFYKQKEFKKCLKSVSKVLPAFIITIVFYIFYNMMLPTTFSPGGVSQFEYLITQPMVIVHYIVTYFVPYNLSADTDWEVYTSILDHRALAGIAIIGYLLYIALKTSKNKNTRLFSFGILWFFIALLPTSSFIPFSEVLNDHRCFIPYIGLTIAFVFGLFYLIQKYFSETVKKKSIQNSIALTIVLFLAANAYGVRERNKVWHTELSLWKDVSIKSPNNGRGLMNYGLALMNKGDYVNAEKEFKKALILNPNYAVLQINLGVVKNALNAKIEAEAHFKKALKLEPSGHQGLYFYAEFLARNNRIKEAKKYLEKALTVSPNFPNAQILLMDVYHKTNDWEPLKSLAEKIITKSPNNRSALKYLDIALSQKTILSSLEEAAKKSPSPEKYLNLSLNYFQKNKFKKTISAAMSALNLKSNCPEAYNNIGIANYRLGNYAKAIEAYNSALNLRPNYTLAKNNLKEAKAAVKIRHLKSSTKNLSANDYLNLSVEYYNNGDFKACIKAAEKSNSLQPNANAFNNICAAYKQLEDYDKAIESCNKAINLDSKHRLAIRNLKQVLDKVKMR